MYMPLVCTSVSSNVSCILKLHIRTHTHTEPQSDVLHAFLRSCRIYDDLQVRAQAMPSDDVHVGVGSRPKLLDGKALQLYTSANVCFRHIQRFDGSDTKLRAVISRVHR
jgi:hypothetical protein